MESFDIIFAKQSSRASFLDEILMSRENNIVIMAYWPTSSVMMPNEIGTLPQCVGEIQYFLKHNLALKGEHFSACVHWYKKHAHFNWLGHLLLFVTLNFKLIIHIASFQSKEYHHYAYMGKLMYHLTTNKLLKLFL